MSSIIEKLNYTELSVDDIYRVLINMGMPVNTPLHLVAGYIRGYSGNDGLYLLYPTDIHLMLDVDTDIWADNCSAISTDVHPNTIDDIDIWIESSRIFISDTIQSMSDNVYIASKSPDYITDTISCISDNIYLTLDTIDNAIVDTIILSDSVEITLEG